MKEKIALLTDSACDLPNKMVKEYDIRVLPLKVIYPDKEYSDRVDIEPAQVYEQMPEKIPTTSMPALQEIKNVIDSIRQEGFTHLLAVHISSGLSGTYEAVELIARDIKDLKIKVVDSKTLSMGTGWMVLEAARNISNGVSFNNILENINRIRSKMQVYYVIETLEYLRKGGRIGLVASMLGEFLHLKPIISVNKDGKYFTFCKAKGRLKSIDKIFQLVEEAVQDKQVKLAFVHGGAHKEFEALKTRFNKLPNIKELITSDISPALGVHTGPGLLGICFYKI